MPPHCFIELVPSQEIGGSKPGNWWYQVRKLVVASQEIGGTKPGN
jgi:hypothetical protein